MDEAPVQEPNWYVIVLGIEQPAAPIRLAAGVTLRPLTHRLQIFDLMGAVAAGFHGASALGSIVGAAVAEIETSSDGAEPPGFDGINRAWLAAALLLLDGHTHILCPAALSYSWTDLREEPKGTWESPQPVHQTRIRTTLPGLKGGLLDLHFRVLNVGGTDPLQITSVQAQWVAETFDRANMLCSTSDAFRFALQAAVDCRYAPDFRAALSRIWAGIEAILGISSELVYRASIVSACLLEPRGPERSEFFHRVKKLYGRRSKAVHGDKVAADDLAHAAKESFSLLRRLLLLCLSIERVPTDEDQAAALFE